MLELPETASRFASFNETDAEREVRLAKQFERDKLRKLVSDELKSYGLLLVRAHINRGASWRTSETKHVLYGQVQPGPLKRREVLHEGDFKECCEKAAKILDALDASQVPSTTSGI